MYSVACGSGAAGEQNLGIGLIPLGRLPNRRIGPSFGMIDRKVEPPCF